jgi:hypothetical protein
MGKPVELDLQNIAGAPWCRRLISMILLAAIRERAEEVHFEPDGDHYKLSFRTPRGRQDLPPPPGRPTCFGFVCEVMLWAKLGRIYHPLKYLLRWLRTLFGHRLPITIEGSIRLLLPGASVPGVVLIQQLQTHDPVNNQRIVFRLLDPEPPSKQADDLLQDYLHFLERSHGS